VSTRAITSARSLAERGDHDAAAVQVLRPAADADHKGAIQRLAGLLIKQGQDEEGEKAERLRRFGLNPDGSGSELRS
jgi:hypothetical protein